jgi:ATP-dependent helicase/nuclease subunit A
MSDKASLSRTEDKQRRASDPNVSAWVSAHAGSGKTYVLTQRVLRLLLAGVRPSQILCLTFTKAAAANMSARIFKALSEWAVLDDAALDAAVRKMGGDIASVAERDFARQLFARAVETPGGLKIQTIHAFCERLLHAFPLEANAPAGFKVLDDAAGAELLEATRRRAIERGMREAGDLHEALKLVARETTARGFEEMCRALLEQRAALPAEADFDDYACRLRLALGLGQNETVADVEGQMIARRAEWPELAHTLNQGSTKDTELAAYLARASEYAPLPEGVENYLSVYFKKDGDPRGLGKQKIVTAGLQKKAPGLLETMESERDRLIVLVERRKAAQVAERSLALARLGDAILSEYAQDKRYRNLLDYDDLIERAWSLLNRSDPSWVLYKLDAQVDHILLDEAQDTSAKQWAILDAIAKEFYAGAGARGVARSFFAVGDDKQSIFSFQGAAPEKFDEMRSAFEKGFQAVGRVFEHVELTQSFRSAPGVLDAVDYVFNHGDNGEGLFCEPGGERQKLVHDSAKPHLAAHVEIWSPVGPLPKAEAEDWRLPLDFASATDPAERLSRKVAAKIRALLSDPRESVHGHEGYRPVEPGDILIVVRKRGALFESLIRALKSAGVPVAGADRLDIANHIAVEDLAAAGRAALLVEDDLTLATVLKSPLFGLDDDDLLEIAPGREGSLFSALAQSARPAHRAAAAQIETWGRLAVDRAPYEFYSHILAQDGGRRRLVARLGPEANDAIDEFMRLSLDFERESAPTLTGFLDRIEGLDISIKRDMEAAGDAVRVMTAHAAKGLEAKIVFLPDTCGAPSGKHDPKLFGIGPADSPSLVWSRGAKTDPAAVADARARHRRAEEAEQRRLLYVAMTRAEERLYIAGYHGENGPAVGCWHKMIVEALEPSCEKHPDPDEPDGYVLRRVSGSAHEVSARPEIVAGATEVPAFARTAAPKESAPAPPLRPSSPLAGADAPVDEKDRATLGRKSATRALIGRLTHALLQYLPDCAPARRAEAARRFLDLRGPGLDEAQREEMIASALALIEEPQLADLFGPGSIAEADVCATTEGRVSIVGRIDRLAVTAQAALIADFKTGAPQTALDYSHLRQLALYRAALAPLYPERRLRCFVIFTQNGSVVEATPEALDDAFARASVSA